ncbi:MAG: hypothetical protein J0H43_15820 [Actinobacteria bacterium]|nr:hypothetical protein [Actinomycetota bacterium]
MLRSLRLRLAGIGRLPRLLAAALCLALAAVSALHDRSAPGRTPAQAAVVVAAHPLAVGHVLILADLAVARWPAGTVPDNARASPGSLVGARLATALHAREPVTSTRLLSGDLAAGLGPDQVATPIPLDDPHVAELVRPGDRVDVVGAPRPAEAPTDPSADPDQLAGRAASGGTPVAAGAPVLAVIPASNEADAELVLAVARITAVQIARDRPTHLFTVFVVAP